MRAGELNEPVGVTVRENRAEAKDRGRPLTSTFLPYKSYLKRISTITFTEVDVLLRRDINFPLIWALWWQTIPEISDDFGSAL